MHFVSRSPCAIYIHTYLCMYRFTYFYSMVHLLHCISGTIVNIHLPCTYIVYGTIGHMKLLVNCHYIYSKLSTVLDHLIVQLSTWFCFFSDGVSRSFLPFIQHLIALLAFSLGMYYTHRLFSGRII